MAKRVPILQLMPINIANFIKTPLVFAQNTSVYLHLNSFSM